MDSWKKLNIPWNPIAEVKTSADSDSEAEEIVNEITKTAMQYVEKVILFKYSLNYNLNI